MVWKSADEVLIAVEVDSEALADQVETAWRDERVPVLDYAVHAVTILGHSKHLHLLYGSSSTVLLSELDGVIFLWHLKTKRWIAENESAGNEAAEVHHHR